jgi:hypothetical protein
MRQPADLIKKKVNEDLSLDKPLHVIYKVSKLAYRIWVILIANKRVKKNVYTVSELYEQKDMFRLTSSRLVTFIYFYKINNWKTLKNIIQ